ncbi:trna nucleotidyltransferase poly polymerase [Vairimorpha apis BRL 01]|uniref:Trna nucleotidyltransferase poly polymerase n=1 Tax=Vairimorpha apis BRL 01 TaxID=1037528 RepID=T0L7J9_9MICR|nr:trna nucleotidyltransferase poly polymerase [Vairimorpha apis BRL 01]
MDIALENISGYNFALLLQSNFSKSISKVSIIQTNPEKSKHLETAVCKIKDKMVDFVNLRTEIYSDSRIPIIIPSNPYEDAFRRDLSINSLFYNIETKEVEDFTKIGLYDIRNHILRTPLDPYLTFKDDH